MKGYLFFRPKAASVFALGIGPPSSILLYILPIECNKRRCRGLIVLVPCVRISVCLGHAHQLLNPTYNPGGGGGFDSLGGASVKQGWEEQRRLVVKEVGD